MRLLSCRIGCPLGTVIDRCRPLPRGPTMAPATVRLLRVFHRQLHRSIVETSWRAWRLPGRRDPVTEVLERLRDAQNRHDLDGFVGCFDLEYRSE
jgi:hypothetical protein